MSGSSIFTGAKSAFLSASSADATAGGASAGAASCGAGVFGGILNRMPNADQTLWSHPAFIDPRLPEQHACSSAAAAAAPTNAVGGSVGWLQCPPGTITPCVGNVLHPLNLIFVTETGFVIVLLNFGGPWGIIQDFRTTTLFQGLQPALGIEL